MKVMSLRSASLIAALAIVFFAADRAETAFAGPVSKSQLQAKLQYCKTCHGLSGQGFRGYFPIPRLAGQQPQYIENQLRAFLEHRRTNPVMLNVTHGLSPWMIPALAEQFKNLHPHPLGGGPKASMAFGKKIFEEGLPDSNVPACFACHGPDAKGHGEIPRLAGQLYWYIVKALTGWTKERGHGSAKDLSAIMVPTTHNLTYREVEAVAAYLSYLK